ncbi:Metacaspase-1 [Forsythia ovata]|uniref:Metacaspase-1 n=1 Tax=Forsythia ovata TaxID=205694 RepID=A0ABD1QKZ7_9LAMI
MATRKERCSKCGVTLLVPLEERTIYCPVCRGIIICKTRATPPGPVVIYRVWPSQISPQLNPPTPAHGRKRAVLCGITYQGHENSIEGSINDVSLMVNLLNKKLGFPRSSIRVLTEEERDPYRIPTKQNIRASLRWLIQGCRSGDSLVFYYSGHASQVRDRDGDEIDGYDEALLPVDYQTEGRILDDEINATIVRPLPQGATLHAIIDTCFSGTFIDLQFVCRINREGYFKWDDHSIPHAAYKGTSGGCAISISACDDHQNSGDTTAFTDNATGALTYSFIRTLEKEPGLTYGRLLIAIHERISKKQDKIGLKGSHSAQEPVLSSSQRFDIHSMPFTL